MPRASTAAARRPWSAMKIEAWKYAVVSLLLSTACGPSLAQQHLNEANARAARLGHPEIVYAQNVSPARAFALGFLPFGVAGLYVDRSRLAASGLLWPFSIAWLPELAYQSAVDINDRNFELRMMNALEQAAPGEANEP